MMLGPVSLHLPGVSHICFVLLYNPNLSVVAAAVLVPKWFSLGLIPVFINKRLRGQHCVTFISITRVVLPYDKIY